MDQKQRHALRAAQLLRDSMLQLQFCHAQAKLPEQLWTSLVQLPRKIERARDRGWDNAARRLAGDLRREMPILQDRLLTVSNRLNNRKDIQVPSAGEMFREIRAMEDEFAQVELDLKAGEISVTTEPISLEGVYLGSFMIRLDLKSIGEPSPYRVVAVEPNPAGSNDSVTHPHVQDETLCEGEGRAAIKSALAAGRVYDFFVLVNQILNTYARGDAYVALSDWDGVTCRDCGALAREDDRVSCRSCEDTLCFDCTVTCRVCGDNHCTGCISTCPECDNQVCDSCLTRCTKCRSATCSDCLVDGLCSRCQNEEEENYESVATTETAGAEPAVQSAGLGQAAFSA